MKPSRLIVVLLALTIAWLGLVATAAAQMQGGGGEGGGETHTVGECLCGTNTAGTGQECFLSRPCPTSEPEGFGEAENCNTDAECAGIPGYCLPNSVSGCPGVPDPGNPPNNFTGSCAWQPTTCEAACVGEIVPPLTVCHPPTPALSAQGFVVFALLLAGMAVVLWRRRRSMSKRTLTGIMTVLLVTFALAAGTYAYGTYHASRACSDAVSLAGLEAPRG